MKTLGIYVHIPYCLHKCPYCDFYSVTDNSTAGRYIDSVLLHMEDYSASARGYDVDTIFIGGGTPTAIDIKLLIKLIDGIYDNFSVTEDAEITVEMNPATAKLSNLKKLIKHGVNRLSIGLQSSNEGELKSLGRIHSFEDFKESFEDARQAGFDNINVDLMYATPNQTITSLKKSLSDVIELNPEHISLYGLKIEDGTPYAKVRNELNLPDEDTEVSMYFSAVSILDEAGYKQYEISNFSKFGRKCLHNLKYWNAEEYIGFGPAAHSYFRGHRFAYKRNVEAYIDALEYPTHIPDIISEDYEISSSERLGEYVMLRLRLKEGIDTDVFAEKFGLSFEKMFGKYLETYIKNGYMEKEGRFYRFTLKGMFVSNYILSAMLDFDSDIINGVVNGTDK